MSATKRIAYWMSDKKSQKINWAEFKEVCARYGFELFKLDLNKSIQAQEPISVILHKLTDIIAAATQGDSECSEIISVLEKYISSRKNLVVIDPIDKVRDMLNRFKCYSMIQDSNLDLEEAFTPNFCELLTTNRKLMAEQIRVSHINYPFICKPQLGHGSKKAHEMIIIFNEENLGDCRVPCVAQSFINHNAVLFKIFVVGDDLFYTERPSVKNFYPSSFYTASIVFETCGVSKAGAFSALTLLEPDEPIYEIIPDEEVIRSIADTLRRTFGMDLLGIDVVVDIDSGRYAIIDVNAYPGYDGFPNLYEAMVQCIYNKVTMLAGTSTYAMNRIRNQQSSNPQPNNNELHSILPK